MRRTYRDYVQDILTSLQEIEEFTKGMNFESFVKDRKNGERRDKELRSNGRGG